MYNLLQTTCFPGSLLQHIWCHCRERTFIFNSEAYRYWIQNSTLAVILFQHLKNISIFSGFHCFYWDISYQPYFYSFESNLFFSSHLKIFSFLSLFFRGVKWQIYLDKLQCSFLYSYLAKLIVFFEFVLGIFYQFSKILSNYLFENCFCSMISSNITSVPFSLSSLRLKAHDVNLLHCIPYIFYAVSFTLFCYVISHPKTQWLG